MDHKGLGIGAHRSIAEAAYVLPTGSRLGLLPRVGAITRAERTCCGLGLVFFRDWAGLKPDLIFHYIAGWCDLVIQTKKNDIDNLMAKEKHDVDNCM